ncbi:DUF3576 domain-containing protein [Candidatus Puniceispirillum sp.]|nr:DUF3576 domain-containing protein [Candidatus Puniceispirillum sp.]
MINALRIGNIIYSTKLFSFGVLILLAACSNIKTSTENPHLEPEPVSILTGKAGGTKILDLGSSDNLNNNMPVNALLWRAALDIASFVPLDDVDTFGGSIITEWHHPKSDPSNRLKLIIFVIGRELRSDAIQVQAHVQKRSGEEWISAGRDESLSRNVENLILTRARELRSNMTATIE